jgi:diguanylate cyclase (GGDEF)-like protein
MVLHDQLTKLPNRTLLEDRLTQAINKAARSNGHFALMFMDLDGFKAINDSLGHHIGDRLLVEVADRLICSMRAHDTVARLGGDEFVILVELARPDDAMPVAEKLVEVVGQPFTVEKHELRVSASVGIAIYPDDGSTRHDLVINADAAMYHTKRSGRNGYNFFEPSMSAQPAAMAAGPARGAGAQAVQAGLPAQVPFARRPGDRRRGAAALAASGAWRGRPG